MERMSGFLIIKKMPSRTTESVTQAAAKAIAEHPDKFKTITLDNGTEFHGYEALERSFPLKCHSTPGSEEPTKKPMSSSASPFEENLDEGSEPGKVQPDRPQT